MQAPNFSARLGYSPLQFVPHTFLPAKESGLQSTDHMTPNQSCLSILDQVKGKLSDPHIRWRGVSGVIPVAQVL